MTTNNQTDQPDYYADGMEAAHSGKSIADCPYQYGTKEADEWINGFEDGVGNE